MVAADGRRASATTPAPWPPTWPAATCGSPPTSASATASAFVLTNDLTYAYIDENKGTS